MAAARLPDRTFCRRSQVRRRATTGAWRYAVVPLSRQPGRADHRRRRTSQAGARSVSGWTAQLRDDRSSVQCWRLILRNQAHDQGPPCASRRELAERPSPPAGQNLLTTDRHQPSLIVCRKLTIASSSASERPSRPTRFVFMLAVDSGAGQHVVPRLGHWVGNAARRRAYRRNA
jgi:hypothetical protein